MEDYQVEKIVDVLEVITNKLDNISSQLDLIETQTQSLMLTILLMRTKEKTFVQGLTK